MPSAEIITIGTEILLGEIVDTNTRYLARSLRGMGVDLYRTVTIGDNVGRIAEALRTSMQHAEIIITTGGLGPTVDDPTRQAIAQAFGTENEYRQELWDQILETIDRYGRQPSENQKRQAFVPRGALVLKNPVGTAPAFVVEKDHNAVIALPGVPKEMEHILHESVVPYLQKRYDLNQIIKVRLLHTAGVPEADIDEKIGGFETLSNPTVGLAAHTGIVDVRITAKAETEAEAERLISDIEGRLREKLGPVVFGIDEQTLEEAALRAAADRNWNLVAVESGLDGALSRRLANTQAGNLLSAETADLSAGDLPDYLKEIKGKSQAQAALGIAAFQQTRSAELMLITPNEARERSLTFGGPPALLPRWGSNIALNWLRLSAQEETQ